MTDKERLGDFSSLPFEERIKLTKESIEKELKESDYYTPKNVCINTQYLLEIIEQAERVQELEELIDKADRHALRNGKEIMKLTDEKTMLEIENKRYREAIEKAIEEVYEEYETLWIVENLQKALEGEE